MSDDTEKYPPNIQRLFQPKPPFPYVDPLDYPPEKRRTISVTPVSDYKSIIEDYLQTELPSREARVHKPKLSKHLQNLKNAQLKRQAQKLSFDRQLKDWNDPELFEKHERGVMKDPYRTVFIARLEYSLTELEVTQHFQKYGIIESVKIIRDHQGNSRGYGFIVYEQSSDASTCVAETCRSGVKLKDRNVLVDIERSRLLKNWKPRRLGGGEGGRHYTREGKVASVAASGRRTNIANNARDQSQLYRSQIESSRNGSVDFYSRPSGGGGGGGSGAHQHYQSGTVPVNSSYQNQPRTKFWSSNNAYTNETLFSRRVDLQGSYSVQSKPSQPLPQQPVTSYASYQTVTPVAQAAPPQRTSIRDKYAKYSGSIDTKKEPTTADKYAKYASIGSNSTQQQQQQQQQQTTSRFVRSIRRD
ncbi:hypothetical protein KGF56_003523 [Candida oxycetoniae]|uniref:RRM domain-containing protein n=1 Tax=Candida oxycetoniae TaxID=497107 RepID=A0AAI9SW95_9ASCO|nr:uncharacterized protein KGF56_003523 [Candida oxycetoniae]KAI3403705.2 hypothetical protein KGF56_003523 [Candida oxycetoniae]